MITKKSKKIANNYTCEKCNYTSSKESDFNKHLGTRKHNINDNELQKSLNKHRCICGKEYKFRQGLSLHKKSCSHNNTNTTINNNIIEHLVKENNDFKNIILEIVKTNSELQKQMLEVCKNSNSMTINNNSNYNSNNNNNNKTFNLQFFLNEQCKDAMNISDFVNSFELQLDDLESVGNLGYVEGITKQFVDKLNGMDIYKRPMHCSDAKRETIYIKDENKWEKEERGTPKLRKAIKTVSFNNLKLVVKWSDTYPESKNNESHLNDKYVKLVKQTTGGNGEISDNEDKIIRRIAKEIIIDK
jgi:hypothetical protein